MQKFKVIALSVGGIGKVFNAGDIVTSNNFPDGNVQDLIDKGFIEESESEKPNVITVDAGFSKPNLLVDEPVKNSDFTKKEIDIALDHLEIEYKPADNKAIHCALLPVSDEVIELLESIKAGTYEAPNDDSNDDSNDDDSNDDEDEAI